MALKTPDMAIIGPGRVGVALGALYARNGGRVIAVGGRDAMRAISAAELIGHGARATSVIEAARSAENVVLSVPDDAIRDVFMQIINNGGFLSGAVVVHGSGAVSSADLAGTEIQTDFSIGSMHPLHTFPEVNDSILLNLIGTYCFFEGDLRAREFIAQIASVLGMIPVEIQTERKVFYHAAAAIASNYLIALLDVAFEVAAASDIQSDTFWQAFRPLIYATIDNVGNLGTVRALTGPIVRGDIGTLRRHLHALDGELPRISGLYRDLGSRAAAMALNRRAISNECYEAMLYILNN